MDPCACNHVPAGSGKGAAIVKPTKTEPSVGQSRCHKTYLSCLHRH